MNPNNLKIADLFKRLAFYLEMDAIAFKPQAYEKAAMILESLEEDVLSIYQTKGKNGLLVIPGIGENMAQKIIEFLKTGVIKEITAYEKKYPINLDELIKVEGIGPKTIKTLYQKLKITNLKELEDACLKHQIQKLPHFGIKTEENILQGINFVKKSSGRIILWEALKLSQDITSYLKNNLKEIEQIEVAGSIRRRKETIGDIDILIVPKHHTKRTTEQIMNLISKLSKTITVLDAGTNKISVRYNNKIDIDFRIIDKNQFGSALQYFTGSKEHNIALRKIAIKYGYKLNEYGLFKGNKIIASKTEKDIYQALKLDYPEPELRENTGEIELAFKHQLPKIIDYHDIKGDLHCHSNWDGGENSIEEMVKAAALLGYQYLGISDHTKFLRIEHGLNEKQLLEQHKAIEKLNKNLPHFVRQNLVSHFTRNKKLQVTSYKFQVLHGCEANILNDGSLDIDNKTLAQLDYVIAGIHSQMKMSKQEMTERIIKAIKNPYVSIISHPTGRLINERDEYQIDMEQILNAAKEYGVALEINSSPYRLDLNAINIRKAIEKGVKLIINTDSHEINHLQFMPLGISQARRGWATKEDIINTWSLNKLLKFIKKEL